MEMTSLVSQLPGWNPDVSLKSVAEWLIPPALKWGGLKALNKVAVASERGLPTNEASVLTGKTIPTM